MENKLTKGRQRVDMKKRESQKDLYATFSKRRSGIFKKVTEMCILCDIDIAIIIFSPTGKPFSFIHPTIESFTRRFQNEDNDNVLAIADFHRTKS